MVPLLLWYADLERLMCCQCISYAFVWFLYFYYIQSLNHLLIHTVGRATRADCSSKLESANLVVAPRTVAPKQQISSKPAQHSRKWQKSAQSTKHKYYAQKKTKHKYVGRRIFTIEICLGWFLPKNSIGMHNKFFFDKWSPPNRILSRAVGPKKRPTAHTASPSLTSPASTKETRLHTSPARAERTLLVSLVASHTGSCAPWRVGLSPFAVAGHGGPAAASPAAGWRRGRLPRALLRVPLRGPHRRRRGARPRARGRRSRPPRRGQPPLPPRPQPRRRRRGIRQAGELLLPPECPPFGCLPC
jgi:hypothetical protein